MKNCSLLWCLFVLCFVSCESTEKKTTAVKEDNVLTETEQKKLTPNMVLNDLLKGNERYVLGEMLERNLSSQMAASINAQFPKAVVLACIDSRVPVEYIFDQGIGDIFVVRVAGNIENEELLGSLEYGMVYSGCKLLMVLGHENCGAVKATINHFESESQNVKSILNQIEPVVGRTDGERNTDNKSYLKEVITNNVHQTLDDIRTKSPLMKQLEDSGDIKIVGAYYSLSNGKVQLLQH